MDTQAVVAATRRWVDSFVIELGLCPFARKVSEADRIRYTVTESVILDELLAALSAELRLLEATDPAETETTLLIHPLVLTDFLDYNSFLLVADRLLEHRGYTGVFQIAGFHPQYRFTKTKPDAAENFTNRSPYPMLHILREESITRVADDQEFLDGIPRRNITALRAMGRQEILRRLAAIQ